MHVVMAEPHRVIEFPGFELRTFQCVGCGDVEKRMSFDGTRSHQSETFVPEAPLTGGDRSPGKDDPREPAEAVRQAWRPISQMNAHRSKRMSIFRSAGGRQGSCYAVASASRIWRGDPPSERIDVPVDG